MNKILTSFLCCFLVLVIIGVSIYSGNNLKQTVLAIKNDFKITFATFDFAQKIVSAIMPKDHTANSTHDSLCNYLDLYKLYLSQYIPYYIENNDLLSRCSNQGLSTYTEKLSIHKQHKVCKFSCTDVWDLEFFGDYDIPNSESASSIDIVIYYCSICDEIIALCSRYAAESPSPTSMFDVIFNFNSTVYYMFVMFTSEELDGNLKPWWRTGYFGGYSGSFSWSEVKNYCS